MKRLEDMNFSTVKTRDRLYIGKVVEFRDLRSKAHRNSLDAIDEIITLTRDRVREIHQSTGT